MSIYDMNFLATVVNASNVQLSNQSIVQQLMRDGNFRHLTLKLSPAGLIHNTICRFDLILEIKKDHKD